MVYHEYQLQLKSLLNHSVRRVPYKEIVYRDQVRYTYEDLYERVQRLANALEDLGVEEDDTIAVIDWDSHRYLESYLSVPSIGCTLHTVNVRYSEENLIYTMKHAEDDYVLVYDEFLPLMERYSEDLESVRDYVILTDNEAPESGLADLEYEEMLGSADPNYGFPDIDEDKRATLYYTTGTTGRPKGVYFSHRKIFLHTIGVALSGLYSKPGRRLTADDVLMPLVPMYHAHSWIFPYIAVLLGMKQVYAGRYEVEMIFDLIRREGVTFSHMVPTILKMLVDGYSEMELPRSDEESLKSSLSKYRTLIGGARLPKRLAKEASEKLGIDVYCTYGLSETCPVLTATQQKEKMWDWDEEDQLDCDVKSGFPLPFVDFKVIDDEGNEVKHDDEEMGELVVRCPWATEGYYRNPERSEELWRGGWLHTGDIATVDEEGYIQIVDREEDLIKSGGEWIGSKNLEDLLLDHEKVKDAAVIGVPDEKWGERPMAFIVPHKGYDPTEGEIEKYMEKFVEKGKIVKYAVPDKVVFLDKLSETSVGKTDKKGLRDEYV